MTKPDDEIYLEMHNFPDCTDVEIKAKRSDFTLGSLCFISCVTIKSIMIL